MTRNSSNGFFERFLDESLQRLSNVLERELVRTPETVFVPETQGRGGLGGIVPGNSLSGSDMILNITIQNNAPVQVTAQESTDALGQKQLEIMIDQMVASSLVRGRQTSSVLGSLFNILPGLSGR